MPLDRTAFSMGTFAEAEEKSVGDLLSAKDRMLWSARATKAAFGYDPDKIISLDRTAFSMRKN